ncbi:MAG: nucleoside triphosphate pyrophosphohydrolase [Bacteroidetes bacterium]|nr:nucleoside triphosphate pyrophosphohydrolase [Bacteroidota bacterium]
MNSKEKKLEAFGQLLDIMDDLREKCPWDKKQDWQSLRHLTLEEVYELSDAILAQDQSEIKKELGDVLLHLVFYAKLGSEENVFDIADVITSLNEKLIFRHPHIYGDVTVANEEEVKQNWEKLKLKEGNKSILSGVPKSLPSLVKAYRIQDKVKGIGFDFPNPSASWKKIEEEFAEFMAEDDPVKKELELGDVLFSLINHARIIGINPDTALERTNQKFIKRFMKMEAMVAEKQDKLENLSLEEMDLLWNIAKLEEN